MRTALNTPGAHSAVKKKVSMIINQVRTDRMENLKPSHTFIANATISWDKARLTEAAQSSFPCVSCMYFCKAEGAMGQSLSNLAVRFHDSHSTHEQVPWIRRSWWPLNLKSRTILKKSHTGTGTGTSSTLTRKCSCLGKYIASDMWPVARTNNGPGLCKTQDWQRV
jgi:hypothetical protein